MSRLAVVAASPLLLAACAASPEPVPFPDVVTLVAHDAGSAASAADVSSAAATTVAAATSLAGALPAPEAALRLTCQVLNVGHVPDTWLEPLASQARLFLGGATDLEPLPATPRLLRGARVARLPDGRSLDGLRRALETLPAGEDPGVLERWDELASVDGALPAGATVEVMAVGPRLRGGLRGTVRLRVHRLPSGNALDASIEVEGLDRNAGDTPGEATEVPVTERAVLEGPVPGRRLALALVLPSPFAPSTDLPTNRPGLVLLVEVAPPPAPHEAGWRAHRAAVAACAGDLARGRAAAASLAQPDPPPPRRAAGGPGASRALDALAVPATRRLALLGLAAETGAPLAVDVATGGGDALVAAVSSRAIAAAEVLGAPRGPALGFCLERAALIETSRALELGDRGDPSAHALLVRAAGGLALRPSVLITAVAAAADLEAWEATLVAENTVLLDDGDAAVRARAADWLRLRRALPEGYDPLATPKARRAALARAARAEEAGGP